MKKQFEALDTGKLRKHTGEIRDDEGVAVCKCGWKTHSRYRYMLQQKLIKHYQAVGAMYKPVFDPQE